MDFSQAQFEGGAAPSGMQCTVCNQPLTERYWSANGAPVCGNCAQQLQAGPPSEGGAIRAFKATLFGAGAGLAGAVGYGAFMYFTDIQFALITIGIGWMIGRSVKTGSEGRGGRGYQVLSAILTYVFCCEAFVPLLVKGAMEGPEGTNIVVASLISIFLALAVPFMGELGPIGILILGFGVYQGWKEAAAPVIKVEGPFELSQAPQEPAPAAAAP
jgi:hypothetical protein